MGSDIHVIVVGGASDCIAVARGRITQLERRWSRFLPDSEISRLNSHPGRWVPVSEDTRLLLHRAIEAWRLTGGSFDPTLLDALRTAGYDRSFEQLDAWPDPARPDEQPTTAAASHLSLVRPMCTDIRFDDDAAMLPDGMGFDPGGIGKGLAADLVAAELLHAGAAGTCVNMGGDVCVLGRSPTGAGWTLGIDHPLCREPIALVGLWAGAVATSSVLRRVWSAEGHRRHHLIDPATGQPSTSDLALASVIAGNAWTAEVMAKAILLRGSDRAFDLLDASTAALAVDHVGRVTASASFASYLGEGTLPERLVLEQRRESR